MVDIRLAERLNRPDVRELFGETHLDIGETYVRRALCGGMLHRSFPSPCVVHDA